MRFWPRSKKGSDRDATADSERAPSTLLTGHVALHVVARPTRARHRGGRRDGGRHRFPSVLHRRGCAHQHRMLHSDAGRRVLATYNLHLHHHHHHHHHHHFFISNVAFFPHFIEDCAFYILSDLNLSYSCSVYEFIMSSEPPVDPKTVQNLRG